MNDDYTRRLEEVIRQMLNPLRNLPFNLVMETLTGFRVLQFDEQNENHRELLQLLTTAATNAGSAINRAPILCRRANEVGNSIEPFVRDSLNGVGLAAEIPRTRDGRRRTMGYPDIFFHHRNIPYYLECKTYNRDNLGTSRRTFYFSPSENMKVNHDSVHFLLSYEIYESARERNMNVYRCRHFKILSLETLSVDVKYEFNYDNARLYSNGDGARTLAEAAIPD